MTFDPTQRYCTCYYDHKDWVECCYFHDAYSVEAGLNNSAEERLKADIQLRECVKASGHPVHAVIMYAGVRAWYWTKWRWIDGITFL